MLETYILVLPTENQLSAVQVLAYSAQLTVNSGYVWDPTTHDDISLVPNTYTDYANARNLTPRRPCHRAGCSHCIRCPPKATNTRNSNRDRRRRKEALRRADVV